MSDEYGEYCLECYCIQHKCDGCDLINNTREVDGLDPRRPNRINYLCKRCDNSYHTIPKILKWNKKYLPETHSIFGFQLAECKNITGIEIKVYVPKQ